MYRQIILTIIFIIIGSIPANAQKIPLFKDPQIDSNYVDLLPGKWSLRLFSTVPYQIFSIRNRENDQLVRYTPNNLLGIGIGFSYRFIVFDLGLNVNTRLTDATSRFDLQMTLIMQKHLIDFYLQTYSGFELKKAPVIENKFREDIRSSTTGINYLYCLNHKKLSIRSAFAGDQLQRRSAGTFTLGGYFSHYRLRADSSIVPPLSQAFFNENAFITSSNFTSMGVGGGYAYNLIFPWNIFLFTSATPSIGLNFGEIEATDTYSPPIGPEFKFNVRAACGYAGPNVYLIFSFISDYFLNDLGEQNSYRYNPGRFKLVFGYRLKSKVEFLEKVNDTFKVN